MRRGSSRKSHLNWSIRKKGGKELGVPVIRDIDDEPILATAIFEGVDVLVTGDKDFLSLELLEPKIMTMAEFMAAFS